ncbi:ATPase, T2SS/T4P/T4SS family [Rhizobium beringeri]
MPNGERFQAGLSPVAASGGAFAIRKQVIRDMTLDDYLNLGGLDDVKVVGPRGADVTDLSNLDGELIGRLQDPTPQARREWLRFAVENRVTMLISGGTSSGKTTFFNGLLKDVPSWERLVSIEDTRELEATTAKLSGTSGVQRRAGQGTHHDPGMPGGRPSPAPRSHLHGRDPWRRSLQLPAGRQYWTSRIHLDPACRQSTRRL